VCFDILCCDCMCFGCFCVYGPMSSESNKYVCICMYKGEGLEKR